MNNKILFDTKRLFNSKKFYAGDMVKIVTNKNKKIAGTIEQMTGIFISIKTWGSLKIETIAWFDIQTIFILKSGELLFCINL